MGMVFGGKQVVTAYYNNKYTLWFLVFAALSGGCGQQSDSNRTEVSELSLQSSCESWGETFQAKAIIGSADICRKVHNEWTEICKTSLSFVTLHVVAREKMKKKRV